MFEKSISENTEIKFIVYAKQKMKDYFIKLIILFQYVNEMPLNNYIYLITSFMMIILLLYDKHDVPPINKSIKLKFVSKIV